MSSQDNEALADSVYFSLRFVVTLGAILVTFRRRIVVVLSGLFIAFKKTPNAEFVVTDGDFVERPSLTEKLLDAVNSLDSETVLLYGDRDGGKRRRLSIMHFETDAGSLLSESPKQLMARISRRID